MNNQTTMPGVPTKEVTRTLDNLRSSLETLKCTQRELFGRLAIVSGDVSPALRATGERVANCVPLAETIESLDECVCDMNAEAQVALDKLEV
jgi:hypothetical protein